MSLLIISAQWQNLVDRCREVRTSIGREHYSSGGGPDQSGIFASGFEVAESMPTAARDLRPARDRDS